MKVLIVGGTRNVGHLLTLVLLEAGHQVTVFNRGQTVDELPAAVTRIHGDRNAPVGLAPALAAADYDAVVDMVLYDGAQAQRAVAQLAGRTGHYLFISTGQVYLVRAGLARPFVEEDYNGGTPVPEPAPGTYDHGEWLYGVDKRAAEDVLARAWQDERFPVTTLRLPMVNSERDHFLRLYNYLLRIRDPAGRFWCRTRRNTPCATSTATTWCAQCWRCSCAGRAAARSSTSARTRLSA